MSNDATSHSNCTADIFEEKDCIGFKSLAGSGMCMFQGLGFACEAEEGRNGRNGLK
jgi:acetoin utilization deacetylase AcuC-like enzyme